LCLPHLFSNFEEHPLLLDTKSTGDAVLKQTSSELEDTRFKIESNSGEETDTTGMCRLITGMVHETERAETIDWLPKEMVPSKASGGTGCYTSPT